MVFPVHSELSTNKIYCGFFLYKLVPGPEKKITKDEFDQLSKKYSSEYKEKKALHSVQSFFFFIKRY